MASGSAISPVVMSPRVAVDVAAVAAVDVADVAVPLVETVTAGLALRRSYPNVHLYCMTNTLQRPREAGSSRMGRTRR